MGEATDSLTLGEVGKRGLAYFSRLARVAEATADKPKLIDHATLPCQDATKDAKQTNKQLELDPWKLKEYLS